MIMSRPLDGQVVNVKGVLKLKFYCFVFDLESLHISRDSAVEITHIIYTKGIYAVWLCLSLALL